MKNLYSMVWNDAKGCFCANVRKPDGNGWAKKWVPKKYTKIQEAEAVLFLESWIKAYHASWLPEKNSNVIVIKSLEVLFPKWLAYRKANTATRPNTYLGFVRAGNWILDRDGFDHLSIQKLDIETELSKVHVINSWIQSIAGKPKSRLQVIVTLSAFYRDIISQKLGSVVSEEMVNPFHKQAIQDTIKEIGKLHTDAKIVRALPISLLNQLASSELVFSIRQVKYLLAGTEGPRDREIQGLIWNDLVLTGDRPRVQIVRQLDKRGCKPFVKYEEELAKGRTKEQIFDTKNAVCSNPKRNSKRIVPLHPETVKALTWWKEIGWKTLVGRLPKGDDPVFARENRSLRDDQNAGDFCVSDSSETLTADLIRIGSEITNYTFHELRHTFATQLADQGVDRGMISLLMGHGTKSLAEQSYQEAMTDEKASTSKKFQMMSEAVGSIGAVWRQEAATTKKATTLRIISKNSA